MTDKIKLGNEVEDMVTGFRGIAEQRIEYLDGTAQFGVRAKCEKGAEKITPLSYVSALTTKKVGEGVHLLPLPKQIGFNGNG